MKMAWKEMAKFKTRYVILGSIIFLISLLTMTIAGLANGLSYDNASLVKNMPEGTFYMEEEAEAQYTFSGMDEKMREEIKEAVPGMSFLSIQMGELESKDGKRHGVVFITSEGSLFPEVKEGEIIVDASLREAGIKEGDGLVNSLLDSKLTAETFVEQQKFSHSPVAFVNGADFQRMYRANKYQVAFVEGENAPAVAGLDQYNNDEFMNTIPSYSAEQLSLNMIVVFLFIISGMLFGIFFYMINVQKIATYGILKAVGVKTTTLFKMMWVQMAIITSIVLILSVGITQLFALIIPEKMPFMLTAGSASMMSLVFLSIGFIGSSLSGIQISRVEPMQAINQGGV